MTHEIFSLDTVREVVGVFHDEGSLQKSVDDLIAAGFAPNTISVMGAHDAIKTKLNGVYESVPELEADDRIPRVAFVGNADRREGEAAVVIGAPMYLLGVGGALAVVATGGAAALALAAAAAGGAVGAGLGAAIAHVMEERHAARVAQNIDAGGLLLWVRTVDDEAERKAIEILTAAGGDDVHAQNIKQPRAASDGRAHWNPDPFLGHDPN